MGNNRPDADGTIATLKHPPGWRDTRASSHKVLPAGFRLLHNRRVARIHNNAHLHYQVQLPATTGRNPEVRGYPGDLRYTSGVNFCAVLHHRG